MTVSRPCVDPDDDAGLSLVEVLVSMLVLTVALLALVPVQTGALATVVLSQERQQATAYANQAIEQVRARTTTAGGFSAVAAGRRPSTGDAVDVADTAGCPSSCRFTPDFDASVDEPLRSAATPDPVLLTERCSDQSGCVTAGSVSGLAFTTRLYVTPTDQSELVNVTAVTGWTSTNSGRGLRQVAVRTQVASPAVP